MISDYIAYWPLDEASGNVTDIFAGYVGTNSGSTVVEGKISRGRAFTSAGSQSINMGNILDMTTNDFSVAFWYKSTSGTSGYFFAKGIGAGGGYLAYFNSAGKVALFLQTDSSNWKQSTYETDTADGIWHHFVGIRSGASNPVVTIYTDGVLRTTTPQQSGTVTTLTNAGDFTLSSSASFYNGSLDEVRVYNRVLSATEVHQLYTFSYNKRINSGVRPRPFAPGLAR